jgi:hypothetical protein
MRWLGYPLKGEEGYWPIRKLFIGVLSATVFSEPHMIWEDDCKEKETFICSIESLITCWKWSQDLSGWSE